MTIHGLQSAPQHNGKQGTVRGFDRDKGRFLVEVSKAETLSIKPDNVSRVYFSSIVALFYVSRV